MVCGICREKNADAIRYGNLPMCNICWEKEQTLQAENMSPEHIEARVAASRSIKSVETDVVEMSQKIDNSIQVRSDIFNAKTQAILDLKAAIDADVSITNKPYALAEVLTTKFKHLTGVIFEASDTIMDANNEQRAIQSFLNTFSNQLRNEEREKLKIADINYPVLPVKSPGVKKIKTTGTKATKIPAHRQKFDKEALRKYAGELGVPEMHLQQLVLVKGISVEAAADILREMLNKMRTQQDKI